MKHVVNYYLLIVLVSMLGVKAFAYDIEVKNSDGVTIYYNYINDGKELEVAKGWYSGTVSIPEEVTFMNRTRKVTSIGIYAFEGRVLTNVTIPNSVTSIGISAFEGCDLTSITIPNSVINIGGSAFKCCSLTSVIIPNSVTTIGSYAFENCTGLTSVTIGNSVTNIGNYAFERCTGLTSVTIPNSVTTIGDYAFSTCIGLTSITIGNSVTSIGVGAFGFCPLTRVNISDIVAWCKISFMGESSNPLTYAHRLYLNGEEIKDLVIPEGVSSINNFAFYECSGLISLVIPNSVISIGKHSFYGIDLESVISYVTEPFEIYGKNSYRTFSLNTFNNATLYVPVGTIDKYKAADGWKDFMYIEENSGGGEVPTTPEKCAKPDINYQNGQLIFTCNTEGATCQYSITDTDIRVGSGNEVKLTATYIINVYATKAGYENSETATATLCWINVEPETEGISGVAEIRANPVMIQGNDGVVNISGVDDSTSIAVYTVSGQLVGITKANGNQASLSTNIKKGEIAIIKIGEKSVKCLMQ